MSMPRITAVLTTNFRLDYFHIDVSSLKVSQKYNIIYVNNIVYRMIFVKRFYSTCCYGT